MAAVAEQDSPAPLRRAPILAGGGRPSKEVELQTIDSLSPVVQKQLKRIYNNLSARPNKSSLDLEGPPLSSSSDFEAWFRTPAAAALSLPLKHDLSYPLSNYFISSSHNTYLSGNQLYGSASGEAYQNVLMRGCRCLEIDVWDGDDENTSSASSSDLDEKQQTELRLHTTETKRDRANSALTRLTHRVKDKASRIHSRELSPRPHPQSERAEHAPVSAQVSNGSETLKPEPRVYHGYTLTKDVSFRTVCHAIKDSAFEATDLPVIVSLEVHCSLEQQETMVEIMQNVFKGHLVDISGGNDATVIDTLPSPDRLRKKILIKVKWTPAPQAGESNNPVDHIQAAETASSEDHASHDKKKKAAKVLQALSNLGVYTRAYSFKHFSQPEAKIPTHVFSLSEAKVEDMHCDPEHGPALFEHNRNFLMRVFPSGLRVNSSNVEPCFLWRQGAQMVALNWQKLDKGTMLNEAMFAGEEGWVLKPEGFRGTSANHHSQSGPILTPLRSLLDLDIEVIAAQNLPLPVGKDPTYLTKMKPYLKVQLHVDTHGPPGQGTSGKGNSDNKHGNLTSKYTNLSRRKNSDDDQDEDTRRLKRKSKSARSSDPDFESELLQWRGIHDVVDELSFLR